MVTKKKLFLTVMSLLLSASLCTASNEARLCTQAAIAACTLADTPLNGNELFPANLPPVQFTKFQAAGFKAPVCGVIHDLAHSTCCGVALGALGTGSLDIQTDGVLGFSSIFPAPTRDLKSLQACRRNAQLLTPFLGLSIDGQTWVLSSQKYIDGGTLQGCFEPGNALERKFKEDKAYKQIWQSTIPRLEGVKPAREIHYWGHYPVADVVYETDAPVAVSMRAWASFIPGDAEASNIPGAVFELRLVNTSAKKQKGTFAFNFPGMIDTDPASKTFTRAQMKTPLRGMLVSADSGMSYAIAVEGEDRIRMGGGLNNKTDGWAKIAKSLPEATSNDPGGSIAVDFKLAPGECGTYRVYLTWFAPTFPSGVYKEIAGFDGAWGAGKWNFPARSRTPEAGLRYPNHYAARYQNAWDVVKQMAAENQALLSRVLAWQQTIYSAKEIPDWLQESLVNNLNLIAKVSVWSQPIPALGDWSYPQGPFGLNESPRSCSIIGCTASNWYGDLPITYFFPELDRMILRNYKAYMRGDGAIPFLYPTSDFTAPNYEWQVGLNSSCFVDLVNRLWMCTANDEVLREFYPAVEQTTTLAMTWHPGAAGILAIPRDGSGQLWWEHTPSYGMVTNYGGVHLATLRHAQRMAEYMGDEAFVKQCKDWFELGSKTTEEKLWNGDNYLMYWDWDYANRDKKDPAKLLRYDPNHPEKDELIMASQLDGEWMARFHGLPGVFQADRVKTALATIRSKCVTPYGFNGFASHEQGAKLDAYGTFSAENHIVAMTYIYAGERDFGIDMVRRFMENVICKQRLSWDLPNMITCDTGERFFGTDYFQNMMLWCLPAAMAGQDLAGPVKTGGLVDRIIKAGASKPKNQ